MAHSLRILHISDFHDRAAVERAAWRRRRVLGDAWLENLSFLKGEGPRFDLVFFTGDIAFSGKAAELASASEFIDATLSGLGVDSSRLFLVPGNHDVDRSISSAEWGALRAFWNRDNDAAMSGWLAGGRPPPGADPCWPDEVMKRSQAYREWIEQKLNRPDLLPKNSPHGRLGYRASLSLPGLPFPVHVVGLDSAWLAGDDNDAQKLRISEDQAMHLSTTTSGDALDGLTLGLIHHPLGEAADGAHCRTLLADKLDLLLRGHLHSAETVTVSDPDRVLTELAAGCLYEDDRYPNGCTALTLSLDDHGNIEGMEVHLRAWSSNGFWFDDASRYRNSQSGRVRLVAGVTHGRRTFSYASTSPTVRGSFGRLEERLRARTHDELASADGGTRLRLPRTSTRDALVKVAEAAIPTSEIVIISGQPGAGKSAVALAVVSQLREHGWHVICLSLRDVPADPAQLDSAFGGDLEESFRAASNRGRSVFVLDGAEAVLEGRDAVFEELLRLAAREQYAVLLVARDDAYESLLARCGEVLRSSRTVQSHRVDGLDANEIAELVKTFPILKGLAMAPGAQWLLRRPGWATLLLRASSSALGEADALSEAQVFAIIWRGLVRRNEIVGSDRATPDGREAVLRALAARELLGTPFNEHDPHVLTSLRRDGLLLPFEPFSAGDEFAHDLIRDFAIARLLLTSSELLFEANAPRWTVHAARLAFQVRLMKATDLAAEVQSQLNLSRTIADKFGERWLDLAIEALAGLAGSISISGAWLALAANRGRALERFTQWLWLHRCENTVADIPATSPFVEMICDHAEALKAVEDDLEDSRLIDALLLAWLRALARRLRDDTTNPLRQRFRELFLRVRPSYAGEWTFEAISLLGPDLDASAELVLREGILLRPYEFEQVVEGVGAHSLAVHRIDVLLFLTEAYYIDDRPNGAADEHGIRGHARGTVRPLAAWYYGPFAPLLRHQFTRTCRLINKLLNHAAKARARILERLSYIDPILTRVSIEVPVIGHKEFIGDEHTWRWYRATGVGPYPCISALMALERVIDELFVQVPELPLDCIVARLLEEAESLAMPGFIFGLLLRHFERVTDEFDIWLSNAPVWHLETARVIGENTSFIIGVSTESSDEQKQRRRWPPRELVQYLVATAILSKNTQRIEALKRAGERLLQTAAATRGGGDVGATARNYASVFDARNYKPVPGAEEYAVQYEPPPELIAELMPAQLALARSSAAWHLLIKYRPEVADPFDDGSASDLLLAKELEANPPANGATIDPLEGPILLASRAVVAHLRRKRPLSKEDWEWATGLLLRNAAVRSDTLFEEAILPFGVDRSVAAALPALYAEFSTQNSVAEPSQSRQLLDAMADLAVCVSTEVRRVLAVAITDIWELPCIVGRDCFHRGLFETIRTAASRCVYDNSGRPTVIDIQQSLEVTLPEIDANSLALNWLTPSIIAIGACASSGCCMADEAAILRGPLLNAHARAMSLGKGQGGPPHLDQRPVAEVLLGAGSRSVVSYMQALGDRAAPIAWFLENLARVAADRTQYGPTFCDAWPVLFDHVLALAEHLKEDRYWGEPALAALMPALTQGGKTWISVETLGVRLDQWARVSAGLPNCVDALTVALQSASLSFQLSDGLRLIRGMMLDFTDIAGRTVRLIEWLPPLCTHIEWNATPNVDYIAIVDGLVAAGDVRFVELQRTLDQRMSRRR